MKIKLLPSVFAIAALVTLAALFPPGRFTWHRFLADSMPMSAKVLYLAKAYALPATLSFTSIILFQLQMRLSIMGAPAGTVFPLSMLGATAMLCAFRAMVAGIGGIPGYVVGLAAGYTVMSRLSAIRPSGRNLLGVQMLEIVWRGQPAVAQRPGPRPALERVG